MTTVLVLSAAFAGAICGVPIWVVAERALRPPRRVSVPVRLIGAASGSVLFAVVVTALGVTWALPAFLFFAAASVSLSIVDLTEKRLPNAITYPSMVVTGLLLVTASAVDESWSAMLPSLAGAAGMFAVYFLLALVAPRGIGMGDVKLAALIGLVLGYLGWETLLIGGTAGFLIGGLVSLVALLTGRATLKTSLPFGPSMLAGAFVAMLAA